jgi:hypothetical protein
MFNEAFKPPNPWIGPGVLVGKIQLLTDEAEYSLFDLRFQELNSPVGTQFDFTPVDFLGEDVQ